MRVPGARGQLLKYAASAAWDVSALFGQGGVPRKYMARSGKRKRRFFANPPDLREVTPGFSQNDTVYYVWCFRDTRLAAGYLISSGEFGCVERLISEADEIDGGLAVERYAHGHAEADGLNATGAGRMRQSQA